MTFQKGNQEAKKKRRGRGESPVTAANCKKHYEKLCRLADNDNFLIFDPKDLVTLFKFEHDSLYGKARETLDAKVEHSGEVVNKTMPVIRELTAEEWLRQFAPADQPLH